MPRVAPLAQAAKKYTDLEALPSLHLRALVDDEGTLRFGWWARNENLKGVKLPPLDPHGKALGAGGRGAAPGARRSA